MMPAELAPPVAAGTHTAAATTALMLLLNVAVGETAPAVVMCPIVAATSEVVIVAVASMVMLLQPGVPGVISPPAKPSPIPPVGTVIEGPAYGEAVLDAYEVAFATNCGTGLTPSNAPTAITRSPIELAWL